MVIDFGLFLIGLCIRIFALLFNSSRYNRLLLQSNIKIAQFQAEYLIWKQILERLVQVSCKLFVFDFSTSLFQETIYLLCNFIASMKINALFEDKKIELDKY